MKRARVVEVVDGDGKKRDKLREKEDAALSGAAKGLLPSHEGLAELFRSKDFFVWFRL